MQTKTMRLFLIVPFLLLVWVVSLDDYRVKTSAYVLESAVVVAHDRSDHNRVRLRLGSDPGRLYATSAGADPMVIGSVVPVYFCREYKTVFLEDPTGTAWRALILPALMTLAVAVMLSWWWVHVPGDDQGAVKDG
jgi:hypothetical protein